MTVRAVFASWIAVVVLLAAGGALLIFAAAPAPQLFHGAPVAVIGSSLMHNAVSNHDEDRAGLLGDGRPHWRVGLDAITEDDTAALLAHAIDDHAKVALVEANVLLFDPAKRRARGRCDQPAARLRSGIKQLQLSITDAYARLFGRKGELDEDTEAEFGPSIQSLPESKRGIYPLMLRGPCRIEVLERLASSARAQGTLIVLVVPPRSNSAQVLLGPGQQRLLAARATALGKALRAAVFITGPWPDAEFLDGEHVNRAGRAHFMAALRQWWNAQR